MVGRAKPLAATVLALAAACGAQAADELAAAAKEDAALAADPTALRVEEVVATAKPLPPAEDFKVDLEEIEPAITFSAARIVLARPELASPAPESAE